MPQLPIVGSDPTQMLGLLNTVLQVSLNPDGTINPASLSLGSMMYGDGSDGVLMFTATPRTVTDAVLTPGSTTITSTTANFSSNDVGLVLDDTTGGFGLGVVLPGSRIVSVQSSTSATMNDAPNAGAGAPLTGDTVTIGAGILAPGSYSTITIPTGATVAPVFVNAPGAVFCSGEFYIDGTLNLGGIGPSLSSVGTTGAGVSVSVPVGSTLLGGNGGNGAGNIGGVTYRTAKATGPQPFEFLANGAGPSGYGAAGGGDGTNFGGSGGANGNFVTIVAKSVVRGPDNVFDLQGGAGQAGGLAQTAVAFVAGTTIPLTVTGANDQLVYTPFGGGAVTFTVASATYTTSAALAAAVNAATGVGGPLSNFVTINSGIFELTAATPGTAANGAKVTPGANDITAAVGFPNPTTLAGGAAGGGNCGGGGGGADGFFMLISDSITGPANVVGGGGAGGAPTGTGTAGSPGAVGFGVQYTPAGIATYMA